MFRLALAGLYAIGIATLAGCGSPVARLDALTHDLGSQVQVAGGQTASSAVDTAAAQLHQVVDVLSTMRERLSALGG